MWEDFDEITYKTFQTQRIFHLDNNLFMLNLLWENIS